MKQEEMSDVSTILIEATDERTAVMHQVSRQTKPVIIVLPEQVDQFFKQPADFFELKRLKRERGISITLVISGHERLRYMARRQGFQVFASTETCARAMARRDRFYAMRGISYPGVSNLSIPDRPMLLDNENDEDSSEVPWSWDVPTNQADIARVCTSKTNWVLAEEQLWHQPSQEQGEHHFGATPLFTDTLHNLVALSATRDALQHPLPDIDITSEQEKENTAFVPLVRLQPTRYGPDTEPLYRFAETEPLPSGSHVSNKLVLLFTALLILGILGGLGFGYALSLLHFNLAMLSFVGRF